MATSPQHARWIRSGMQWQLARPLVSLRDRLRSYGYTVYDIGDTRHLDHIPPEDHTPYSETGWPKPTPYGWVTAIDIMPPPVGRLPSLQQLGNQLYADRVGGLVAVSWLKYMNWGPVSDASAKQDAWEPNHVRRSSSDVGHIHLSCRSDMTASNIGNTYDPVARLRGVLMESEEEPMPFVAKDTNSGRYYVCDLITSRFVPSESVKDVLYLAKQLNYGHGQEGTEWTDGGWTRVGWTEAAFGTLQTRLMPGAIELGGKVAVSGTLDVSTPAAPTS